MFWRTVDAAKTGALANLLDKPDLTLRECLDDDYILQEVKCGNKKLVEFLSKPENLVALTALCVTEPTNDEDEKKKYRYCHLASEILNADAQELTLALAKNPECFRILSAFMVDNSSVSPPEKRVNPLLASFFTKIFILLVVKHLDQVLEYMQAEPGFLNNLISNLDVSAVMDSLFRLAFGGENEEYTMKMKSWLSEQEFVSKLISQFDVSRSEESQQNLSFLLCELIRCLREVQYGKDEKTLDPVLEQLQSPATLNNLLDRMFSKDESSECNDSIILNGCAIFLTFLQSVYVQHNPLDAVINLGKGDQNTNPQTSVSSLENPPINVNTEMEIWTPDPDRVVEKCLLNRLGEFKRLLNSQGKTESLLLPMGTIEAPLGAGHLILTKLLVQMLVNGLPAVHSEVARLDLIQDLTTLFFKHKWNNFLHTNVVNIIICALYCRLPKTADAEIQGLYTQDAKTSDQEEQKGEIGSSQTSVPLYYPSPLLKQILESQHILKLLVDNCLECIEISKTPGAVVPPYVGHLMRIAVCTHFAMREGPHRDFMQEIIQGLPEDERNGWNKFVEDHLLSYIKRNEPDQVKTISCGDMDIVTDRSEDFGAKMAASLEQAAMAFAEFNSRKTPAEIPDDFGYASDAFTIDQEEPIYQLMAKAADINFQMDSIPEPQGESAFEDMCARRINLGNSSSDEELEDGDQDKTEWMVEKEADAPIAVGGGEPIG